MKPADEPAATKPKLGFGKECRMRASGEFRQVREQGKSRAGRYLVMNVLRLPRGEKAEGDAPASRYGFITSRKVGKAVQRNLVRRRLREIVRLHRGQLKAGCWVVTVARYTAAQADYQTLQEEWLRLARQLGILPAHSQKNEG